MRRAEGRDDRRGGDDRAARGGLGMTVFDDVNFEGAALTIRRDVPDLRALQFNDRISSVQVPPGESWEVCENTNYDGRCFVVSGVERDLRRRGLNDVISSMRRVQGREDRGDRDDPNNRRGVTRRAAAGARRDRPVRRTRLSRRRAARHGSRRRPRLVCQPRDKARRSWRVSGSCAMSRDGAAAACGFRAAFLILGASGSAVSHRRDRSISLDRSAREDQPATGSGLQAPRKSLARALPEAQ